MDIFPEGIGRLQTALDVASARHTVIASNIANIDTPGYTAKVINFQDAFQGALNGGGLGMKRSVEKHLSGMASAGSMSAYVKDQVNNSMRNDGNNVNIDTEMMALSQNNILYNMAAQLIGSQFNSLKYAISEGRRG